MFYLKLKIYVLVNNQKNNLAAEEEKIQIVFTYKSTQRSFEGYYSCRQ